MLDYSLLYFLCRLVGCEDSRGEMSRLFTHDLPIQFHDTIAGGVR